MRRTRHSRVSLLFDTRSGNDVQYIKLFSQTSLVAQFSEIGFVSLLRESQTFYSLEGELCWSGINNFPPETMWLCRRAPPLHYRQRIRRIMEPIQRGLCLSRFISRGVICIQFPSFDLRWCRTLLYVYTLLVNMLNMFWLLNISIFKNKVANYNTIYNCKYCSVTSHCWNLNR